MVKCHLCTREIDDEFVFCPFCGEPQTQLPAGLLGEELSVKIGEILGGAQRRLQAVIGALSRYIETPVVDSIISGDMGELHGVRREVTILFSDIRNSSGIIARLEPEEGLELLNNHHDRMAATVQATDGVLDKFIGDGMMAFYSKGELADHAVRAVRAALRMREYVTEANEDWPMPDIPFRIGVGINTGVAVVGSVGSRYRQDYTAVGAEVNYVSDLQIAAKEHAVDIVISRSTHELVADRIEAKQIGVLQRPPDDEQEPVYYVVRERRASDQGKRISASRQEGLGDASKSADQS